MTKCSPIQIIFQDEFIVACNKPPGLLVHRSNIDAHENEFLLQYLRDQIGCFLYPVHRLDKPTSGLIIFARSDEVAASLKKQMEDNLCTKDYLLVCRGYTEETGLIDYPLKPINDFKGVGKKAGKYLDKPAQHAQTRYKRLATIELPVCIDRYPTSRYSLVLASLLTGRKHQIRRHFKHISHPIIGCPKYGKSLHNRFFSQDFGVNRLLLHSYQITLTHPVSGQRLSLVAGLEGEFLTLLSSLGWLDVCADFSHQNLNN